ncbi:hypothetical protein DCC62_06605 [candidate division KSB1 bacterium]|nr:MAG: hypothetical protein DCC62_06605 [candidate division KSB1 bacterium]
MCEKECVNLYQHSCSDAGGKLGRAKLDCEEWASTDFDKLNLRDKLNLHSLCGKLSLRQAQRAAKSNMLTPCEYCRSVIKVSDMRNIKFLAALSAGHFL